MIVIKVELHSAVTRQVTELARMQISNTGAGTATKASYAGAVFRGRSTAELDRKAVQREGRVEDYPRQRVHVWHLVAAMLLKMGYAR